MQYGNEIGWALSNLTFVVRDCKYLRISSDAV